MTRRQLRGCTVSSRIAAGTLASLVAFTFTTRTAHAGEKEEARRHFKAGMELIQHGKYDEGIAELEAAQEILPHPNVLYNIARAYAESGKLDKALEAYKKYLDLNPPDKDEVTAVTRSIEARLARAEAATREAERLAHIAAETPTGTGGAVATGTPTGTGGTGTGTEPSTPVGGSPTVPKAVGAIGDGTDASTPAGAGEVGREKTQDVYEDTVFTASKGAQSPLDSPNSTYVITEQDIRLSGVTNVAELLRRVPGVDMVQMTGSDYNVSIRGFDQRLSNKLLVLVDGRSIFIDIIGTTFWDSLSIGIEDIERIEVVRGPGSALYGADAFTGVVNIITKKPGEGKNQLSAGVGTQAGAPMSTYHATGSFTGHSGEWNYRLSTGFDQVPRWDREVATQRIDVQQLDPNTNVGTQLARVDLRLTRQLSRDVQFGIGTGVTQFFERNFYGLGPFTDLKGNATFSDVTTYIASPHWNFRAFWNRIGGNFGSATWYIGDPSYNGHVNTSVVDGELEYTTTLDSGSATGADCGEGSKPDTKCGAITHDLHVGVGYRLKTVDWAYLDGYHSENHYALYAQYSAKLLQKLIFVGSLRGDYEPYENEVIPSPRGSIIYKRTSQDAFRFTVSSAFRAPSFLETYLNFPVTTPETGAEVASQGVRGDDPNFKLKVERILATEVGYQNQLSDYFNFEVNVYYNRVTDLIALAQARPATPTSEAQGAATYDPVTGRYVGSFGGWTNDCQIYNSFGGEAAVRAFPATGVDVYASYAYNDVHQTAPAGCVGTLQDQRTSHHKVSFGGQIRTKPGLDGSLDISYVSSQLWAEQLIDFTTQQVTYQQFPLSQQITANVRLGYRFKKEPLEVSVSSTNVTGTTVRDHPFGQLIGRRIMFMATYRF